MNLMSVKLRGKWHIVIWAMILSLAMGMFVLPKTSSAVELVTTNYSVKTVNIEGGPASADDSTPIDLSAHVYVPKGDMPVNGYPAIVFIHSWCMNEAEYEAKMIDFASRGYITICYTCRGWYFAPGEVEVAGPLEMQDLNKVVDWLIGNTPVDQANIGATGISYGGGQSLLALQYEPRIKTVIPMSGWADLYESLAPNHSLKLSWVGLLMATGYTLANPGDSMANWLSAFLTEDEVQMENTMRTLAERSPVNFLDEINSRDTVPPVFIIQGINDDLFTSRQMIDFYDRYAGEKKVVFANGVHATAELPGIIGLPSSIWDDAQNWFDYWLKGVDNGIMNSDPISIYQSWINNQGTYAEWPVANETMTLYPAKGLFRGQLNTTQSATAKSITLKNSPFSLATSGVFFISPMLQSYLGMNIVGATPLATSLDDGSALFETDHLDNNTVVCGTPNIKIQVVPENDMFQLNFSVYDVNMLGVASLVAHLPYTGYKATPGSPYSIDVDMNILAHQFKKGHKIRLVVSTSDIAYVKPVSGNFDVNLTCGGNNGFKLELPVN